MSNSKETASLILRTSDITTDDITSETLQAVINNSVGSIDNSGQFIIWKSIDARLLLGDMYEKFSKFNMNVSCYSSRKVSSNLTDCDMTFFISGNGIQFSNQGYNLATKSISNKTVLFTTYLSNTTAQGAVALINNNTVTFNRPNGNFDLTIDMRNGLNKYMTQIMNHQTIVIDIVGCDGYQQNPIINNQELPRNNIDNRLNLPSFR